VQSHGHIIDVDDNGDAVTDEPKPKTRKPKATAA
jgi:hypothetical protein